MEKKPTIRFEGYTDAWEQRKLGEVTDKVTEKNTGLQYIETFTNSAEFGIISQRDFFDHDIAKLNSLDGYYIVRNEDFVYNPRISTSAPVGPINRNKLGRTGVMSPLYTVFRPHDIDNTYLEYFFKCGYWHTFMNFNGDSGARSDRFSIKDNVFFQMPIPIPCIEEQRKIGSYMTWLDHLITLHQRNYEKMVVTKESMLDKLFPQGDTKVPAIRFEGFVGNWEKKPLGAIVIPYSNPVEVPHNGYERLGIRSHGKGVFHEYVEAGKEITTAQLHRVVAHNLIVNITFAWEHAVAVTCDSDAGKLVSHRFPQFSMADGIYDQFLKYLILDARFRHHLLLSSPGGAGRNRVLKIPEMLEYEMMVPDIEEQKQIAGYLNSLDELIELYRIRVEKLKNIKAACLQGMFV